MNTVATQGIRNDLAESIAIAERKWTREVFELAEEDLWKQVGSMKENWSAFNQAKSSGRNSVYYHDGDRAGAVVLAAEPAAAGVEHEA